MKSYPATLIGRLGVSVKYKRQKIGDQLLDFIKSKCVTEDANKCRFILVDAYNNNEALGFYSNANNEFTFLFSTEQQEKDHYEINGAEVLKTRFMFFDLLSWAEKVGQ
jgi:ribosomal protein S18 acetylase RimI-like enzyme